MKKTIAACCLLLAACAAPQTQVPARQGSEAPTLKGQRDLEALAFFFTGRWETKPGEDDPQLLRVAEFWKGTPVRWFYLEWVKPGAEAKPRRQLVLRMAESGEGHLTTSVSPVPEPARYVGEWAKGEPFVGLKPSDFRPVAECRLETVRTMTSAYTLVTDGNRCASDLKGYPFMRFEFMVTSSDMDVLEQALDAKGEISPEARNEPYHFAHMSLEAR
jgi:hypothetical protein